MTLYGAMNYGSAPIITPYSLVGPIVARFTGKWPQINFCNLLTYHLCTYTYGWHIHSIFRFVSFVKEANLGWTNRKEANPECTRRGAKFCCTIGEQGGQPYVNKKANPECAIYPWPWCLFLWQHFAAVLAPKCGLRVCLNLNDRSIGIYK